MMAPQQRTMRHRSRRAWKCICAPLLVLAAATIGGLTLSLADDGADKATTDKDVIPLPSYTVKLPNTVVEFTMILVPGGTFQFTDPTRGGEVREVRVDPFWIGKTEVTWDEYDVFSYKLDLKEGEEEGPDAVSRPSRAYEPPDRGFGHDGYAALCVTYYGAKMYCRWLTQKTGDEYRLPTEIEWEYACRTGLPMEEHRKRVANLDEFAWYWDNADDQTHPVASKRPNRWGLYDMLGNAAEWCRGLDYYPVVRGGSYDDDAEDVTCTRRVPYTPDWKLNDPQDPKGLWWLSDAPFVGFRVVRTYR